MQLLNGPSSNANDFFNEKQDRCMDRLEFFVDCIMAMIKNRGVVPERVRGFCSFLRKRFRSEQEDDSAFLRELSECMPSEHHLRTYLTSALLEYSAQIVRFSRQVKQYDRF